MKTHTSMGYRRYVYDARFVCSLDQIQKQVSQQEMTFQFGGVELEFFLSL